VVLKEDVRRARHIKFYIFGDGKAHPSRPPAPRFSILLDRYNCADKARPALGTRVSLWRSTSSVPATLRYRYSGTGRGASSPWGSGNAPYRGVTKKSSRNLHLPMSVKPSHFTRYLHPITTPSSTLTSPLPEGHAHIKVNNPVMGRVFRGFQGFGS
jgi:hypothetical protein